MSDTDRAMTYSFFNHLNLVLESNGHRGYGKYFRNEYSRIASTSSVQGAPTVTVKIVDRLPDEEPGDLRHTVRYKRLFSYRYVVRGLETDDTIIFFESHPVDKVYMNAIGVFLQAQVLEPVMYLKLLKRNVLFMHAAGVATDKHGYLFPAHGGTGKTTLSIALLGHGYRLLGDDLLFVDIANGKVHSYQRPLHLFTYNVRNLQGARVPLRYRVAIYAKNVVRYVLEKVTRTEFLISTRVHADELFSENPYGGPVPYRKLCFLVKTGDPVSDVRLNEGNIPQVTEEIMQSEDLNDSLYEILDDDGRSEGVRRLERKVIGDLLQQFSLMSYINTRQLDLGDLSGFVQDVLDSDAAPPESAEPATV